VHDGARIYEVKAHAAWALEIPFTRQVYAEYSTGVVVVVDGGAGGDGTRIIVVAQVWLNSNLTVNWT
jgi:hypothetical protein